MVGKQHRDTFKCSTWREKKTLQLIHSDLCGPMNPTSKGGARYILTFTNNFSRNVWVYFLKQKDEVFNKFDMFLKLL